MYKTPSRDQLSKFLTDHQLIKAFEQVFTDTGKNFPDLFASILTSIISVKQSIADSEINAGATLGRIESMLAEQTNQRDIALLSALSPSQAFASPQENVSPADVPYTPPNFVL